MTVKLHRVDGTSEDLEVTWFIGSEGTPAIHVAHSGGGWSWNVKALRGLDGVRKDEVGLPGGGYLTGMTAAVAALDDGTLPVWS